MFLAAHQAFGPCLGLEDRACYEHPQVIRRCHGDYQTVCEMTEESEF